MQKLLKITQKIYPVIALLLFPLVTFWSVFKREKSLYINFDNVEQFYPWYQKLSQAIHNGYLPIWDANIFGGHSFVGEFQSGAFYPVNLLYVLIFGNKSGIDVIYLDILVIFHFFLASFGMYLLLRSWKVTKFGALAGGLVFSYMGAVASRAPGQVCIFYGLALLPFPLLFLSLYFKKLKNRYLVLVGIFLGLQILAGHIQPFFHTLLLTAFYFIIEFFRIKEPLKLKLKNFAKEAFLMSVSFLTVALFQLFLAYQYIYNAYRWVGAPEPIGPKDKVPFFIFVNEYIIYPSQLFNIFSKSKFPISDGNDIYIGLIPLLLVLLYLLLRFFKNKGNVFKKYELLVLGSLIFGLVVVLGHHTFVSYLIYKAPFFNKVRELGRYVILIHFALSALVGFAISLLQTVNLELNKKTKIAALGISLFIFIQLIYTSFVDKYLFSKDVKLNLIFIAILFFTLALVKSRKVISLTALSLVVLNVFISVPHILNKTDAKSYPTNYFAKTNIISYMEAYYGKYRYVDYDGVYAKNIADVYKLQSIQGHGATMYKPYYDFLSQDWSLDSKMYDLLNVRFVVSKTKLELPLILEENGVKLYERKNYYPRAYFKSQLNMKGIDIEKANKITLLEYKDQYQKYEINLDQTEDIIFSEINYPGWKAYIDGNKVDIKEAQIDNLKPLFRQIMSEKGKHIIEFKYLF